MLNEKKLLDKNKLLSFLGAKDETQRAVSYKSGGDGQSREGNRPDRDQVFITTSNCPFSVWLHLIILTI